MSNLLDALKKLEKKTAQNKKNDVNPELFNPQKSKNKRYLIILGFTIFLLVSGIAIIAAIKLFYPKEKLFRHKQQTVRLAQGKKAYLNSQPQIQQTKKTAGSSEKKVHSSTKNSPVIKDKQTNQNVQKLKSEISQYSHPIKNNQKLAVKTKQDNSYNLKNSKNGKLKISASEVTEKEKAQVISQKQAIYPAEENSIRKDINQILILAEEARKQGKLLDAVKFYQKILNSYDLTSSERAAILNNIGVIYLKQNKPYKAEEFLKEAYKLSHDDDTAKNLVIALLMQGKQDKACQIILQKAESSYKTYAKTQISTKYIQPQGSVPVFRSEKRERIPPASQQKGFLQRSPYDSLWQKLKEKFCKSP